MKEFEKLNRIGEGTYGIVCKRDAGCSLRAWGRAGSRVEGGAAGRLPAPRQREHLGLGLGGAEGGSEAEGGLISAGVPPAHNKPSVRPLGLSAWPVLFLQTEPGTP